MKTAVQIYNQISLLHSLVKSYERDMSLNIDDSYKLNIQEQLNNCLETVEILNKTLASSIIPGQDPYSNIFSAEIMSYIKIYMNRKDNKGIPLYEYCDNLRIAYKDDWVLVQEYEELKQKGCCGFEEYIEVPKSITEGRDVYFGFNYGH
jgi:hypothetical protein